MRTMKLYQKLATLLVAVHNCRKSGNIEWHDKHNERINALVYQYMPSGAGWDNGTTFDRDASNANKLVFRGSYHHMNDGGTCDGWTDHTITVVPSLAAGFDLRISGRDRNDIKDYLAEMFRGVLNTEISG